MRQIGKRMVCIVLLGVLSVCAVYAGKIETPATDAFSDRQTDDEAEVTVSDKKVIFPLDAIRSISMKSWSRKEQKYNPPKECGGHYTRMD